MSFVLTRLANVLQPGAIRKINNGRLMAFTMVSIVC